MKKIIVLLIVFFASIHIVLGNDTLFLFDSFKKKENTIILNYKLYNVNSDKELYIYVVNKKNNDTIINTFSYYKYKKLNTNYGKIAKTNIKNNNLYSYINKYLSLPPGQFDFIVEENKEIIFSKLWVVDSLLSSSKINKNTITNEKLYQSLIRKDKANIYNYSNGKIEVYYQGIFHGYYDTKEKYKSNINLLKNELSIVSDLKKNINDSVKREISGNIELNNSFSNQVDPFTNYNNNFSEISGNISLPVLGIPLIINGYYTTQDNNRTIKSSFFNFNLDINKIEEIFNDNKKKFNNSINNAVNEKLIKEDYYQKIQNQLQTELTKQKKIIIDQAKDSIEKLYVKYLLEDIDSTTSEFKFNKDLMSDKQMIQKYDSVLLGYNQMINKLKILDTKIKNYKEKLQIDSLEIFNKYKQYDFANPEEVDKVLLKMYPEISNNKTFKILKKIKTLNVGMISDGISKYTNPGLQNKGINFKYDFEYFDVALAGGNITTINLDTSKTQLFFYNLGLSSKITPYGQFNIVLMDYLNRNIFIKKNSNDGLKQSIDKIYSFKYGLVKKKNLIDVQISSLGEVMNKKKSFLNGSAINIISKNFLLDGNLEIDLEYERIGSEYTIPTLQYLIKGTNKYVIGTKGYLFNRKIKYGIGWNMLLKEGVDNNVKNQKMAFDFQTNLKLLPNVKISYKPFTTFNTIRDTLTNVSFALSGDIFTSNISYKKVNKQDYLNLDLLYTMNSSNSEYMTYKNSNLSFMFGMKKNKNTYNFSLGKSTIQSPILSESQVLMNNNYFISNSFSLPVFDYFNLTLGGKIGWNEGEINNSIFNITIQKKWKNSGINSFVNYVNQNLKTNYDIINISMINLGFSLPINLKY